MRAHMPMRYEAVSHMYRARDFSVLISASIRVFVYRRCRRGRSWTRPRTFMYEFIHFVTYVLCKFVTLQTSGVHPHFLWRPLSGGASLLLMAGHRQVISRVSKGSQTKLLLWA